MPTNPSTSQEDQSIKLSVTVKSRLEARYDPADLQLIEDAVRQWIEADVKRGIQTVHVHVDDPTEMNARGVQPVSGEATAEKIKQAIEDLWNTFTPEPDYLVLFGGEDIVPMFQVPNPAIGMRGLDPDPTVPSDNPYATHLDFSPSDPKSYVVPERAIGRIPDMVSDPAYPNRKGDAGWLLDYLKVATNWKPKAKSFYKRPYAICTAEAEAAATEFMQKTFTQPGLPLLCPPVSDSAVSPAARNQLSARLHMIKCHGNKGDATFWGFPEFVPHTRENASAAINSATLKALLQPSTVVASMCCYGAQIFSPSDPKARSPGEWPMASTYLRQGALGFIGSTMMAWVGTSAMGPADWIVQGYVKNVLAGASTGNAFLACKQDYRSHYSFEDNTLSDNEEKTLIEYVLLGDPSIHPVRSSQSAKALVAVQSRRRRRDSRKKLAEGMRECLPKRSPATDADKAMADKVFIRAKKEIAKIAKGDIEKLKEFDIDPTTFQVKRVDAPLPGSQETRQSLEFYWSGTRDRGGQKQVCVLKAETDRKGSLVPGQAAVVYSS